MSEATNVLRERFKATMFTGDFDRDFRAWIVFGVSTLFSIALILLSLQDLLLHRYLAAAVIAFCPLVLIFGMWLLAWHGNLEVAAMILIVTCLFTATVLVVASGGRAIGSYVFLPTIVLVTAIVANRRFAFVAAAYCFLLPLLGAWVYSQDWLFPIFFDEERMAFAAVRTAILNCAVTLGCMLLYERANHGMRRRLIEAQALTAQSQKLEAIGTLAAGIAHEINTPIQYVSDNVAFTKNSYDDMRDALDAITRAVMQADGEGTAELRRVVEKAIEDADLEYVNDELPRALEETSEGLDRIKTIVNAMKVFSHPGQQERTAVDLNEAIRSTLVVCQNRWKHVASMVADLDEDLPMTECMPDEINQVILNIVVNAADAIQEQIDAGEREQGEIRVATALRDGCININISDDGPGIPEEVRDRVFDPFFTTKEVGKGTGQGLAISYDVIVNRHNGELGCSSETGKGTEFRIRLPIVRDAVPVG